jgi:hypothetical protein
MAEQIITVEITDKVSVFNYNGRIYKPGERLDIPERLFHSGFMKRLSPVPVEAKPSEGIPASEIRVEASPEGAKIEKRGKGHT